MKVIVFDLDDTLYDEMTFVKSGIRAVSEFLQAELTVPAADSYHYMVDTLRQFGRGKVFDCALEHYGISTRALVNRCLQVYRTHKPHIELFDDAKRCLDRLAGYSLYIVTDGNKLVQFSKLRALGLYDDPRIKKCYITRRYGVHHEKPSPHCFYKIAEAEKAEPDEIVYIGDNPHKDFVGIKSLGFRTVRVVRGSHAMVRLGPEYEADEEIVTLDEFLGGHS